MDYYLTQAWEADAKFCQTYARILSSRNVSLTNKNLEATIPDQEISSFWTPDTFMMNAKSTFMQSSVFRTRSLTIQQSTAGANGSQACHMTSIAS